MSAILTLPMLERKAIKLCAAFFLLGTSFTFAVVAIATPLILRHYRTSIHVASLAAMHAHLIEPRTIGPWGNIEALKTPLANADGILPDQIERFQHPKWIFENCSDDRLIRFFDSCDLRPTERRILLNKWFWKIRPNGFEIAPSDALIWSLDRVSREQIYAVLAKNSANYSQCFPFVLPGVAFEQRLKENAVTVQNVEKIIRLTYTNGDNLCFTDLHTAKEVLSPDQFKLFVGVLYETPAYRLRLRVTPDSDIDALAKYWGKGGREKRIKPLLSALAKVP